MTTRGQKRSNETVTPHTSESGAVLEMLTGSQEETSSIVNTQGATQTTSVVAKEVAKGPTIGPALAKDTIGTNHPGTCPATAKDKG